MIRESKSPLARLHALAALDAMKALSDDVLQVALADEHPGVVAHAIRLCEGRFEDDSPLIVGAGKRMDIPAARLALAVAVGSWDDPKAGSVLGLLLRKYG